MVLKNTSKQSPAAVTNWLSPGRQGLLLAIITLLVYANTLQNSFALDDYLVIRENELVKRGISAIPEILTTSYHHGYQHAAEALYRPLSLVVFAITTTISQAPFLFHLVNIVMFALCILLLQRTLLRTIPKHPIVTLCSTAIFALHPIHTEVVANCKGLDDILCLLFSLLSISSYLNYRDTGRNTNILLSAICLLLAFLAKETAIITAMFGVLLLIQQPIDKHQKNGIAIGIGITAIYILIRFSILHTLVGSTPTFIDNPLAAANLSMDTALATKLYILGRYILLLFIPYPLSCDYTFNTIPLRSFADPTVWVSLLSVIVILFIAVQNLFAKSKNRTAGFAATLLFISLLFFSNIFFTIGSNMAERFLFFPSIGFAIAIPALWASYRHTMQKRSSIVYGIISAILLLGYIGTTFYRNTLWKDNLTLFAHDAATYPSNARLHFLYGNELLVSYLEQQTDQSTLNLAFDELKAATNIYPDYLAAQTELGKAYFLKGDLKSAEQQELAVLKKDSNAQTAKIYLSSIYLSMHDAASAAKWATGVLSGDPTNNKARFNLAAAYTNAHNYTMAIKEFRTVVLSDPTFEHGDALKYLTLLFQKTGHADSANYYQSKYNTR